MPTLRPYQTQFVAAIRAAYAQGSRSVLGVLPTGGGKTMCFSHMAKQASEKGLRVGIVAHRVEILDQISAALFDWGVPHGFIAPNRTIDPLARVQVCSVQSLARRLPQLSQRPFDFLIVDEAHHAAEKTSWGQIIALHRGKHVLGVTATPQRLSGEPLSAFQTLVEGPSTAALIPTALSPYRAYAPVTPEMHSVKRRAGDYDLRENEAAMDKPTITGDAVREYLRRTPGKRAVAFCVSVSHAAHVAECFRTARIPAEAIDGKMHRGERNAAIARFRAGETMVLTSADLVSEGFDLPAIETAILLRPTQSLGLYLQQVGRALRPYPGKERAVILDHAGNIERHGLPDDERVWSLEGREKRRGGVGGEATIPVMKCAHCFYMARSFQVCPSCGKEREIKPREVEAVEGELAEVDVEAMRRARKQEIGRARTLPELAEVAVRKGYKIGWIGSMMQARGQRPPNYGEVFAAVQAARQRVGA